MRLLLHAVGTIGSLQSDKTSRGARTQLFSFGGHMSMIRPLRLALITCDDIFDAGGVSASITRIARGLSTNYNVQVDILMLNSNQHTEFNQRGRNGITKLDQRLDNVTLYKLTSWTGGSSAAQHWVDVHYA